MWLYAMRAVEANDVNRVNQEWRRNCLKAERLAPESGELYEAAIKVVRK